MKNIKNLIAEVQEIENLEELESSADLLEYGIEKGCYSKLDVKNFYITYHKKRVEILTKEVSSKLNISVFKLFPIIQRFKGTDFNELIQFVKSELKRIYKTNKQYKEINKFA